VEIVTYCEILSQNLPGRTETTSTSISHVRSKFSSRDIWNQNST